MSKEKERAPRTAATVQSAKHQHKDRATAAECQEFRQLLQGMGKQELRGLVEVLRRG